MLSRRQGLGGRGGGGRPEGEGVPGQSHPSLLTGRDSRGSGITIFSRARGSRARILVTPIACGGSQFATTGVNEGAITVANPPHICPGLVLMGGKYTS